jgi:hypothetical protein
VGRGRRRRRTVPPSPKSHGGADEMFDGMTPWSGGHKLQLHRFPPLFVQ